MRNQNKNNPGQFVNIKDGSGFTLIELMVTIAIIALLGSIVLIALMSARQKSRDAKRISDMVQMNTAMALYFSTYRGYPSNTGIPTALVPEVASSLPLDPQPVDGPCKGNDYPAPVPAGNNDSQYYYYPSGTSYLGSDGTTMVNSDYGYYFCLGSQTGDLPAGVHISSPSGLH